MSKKATEEVKMSFFRKRTKGSEPIGFAPLVYTPPVTYEVFYQVHQNWLYPSVPAHETRAALTNNWMGNQLPSPLNYIPGVPLSGKRWNVPTSYPNALSKNVQFNRGFNIQGYTAIQSSTLQAQLWQAWQNSTGQII